MCVKKLDLLHLVRALALEALELRPLWICLWQVSTSALTGCDQYLQSHMTKRMIVIWLKLPLFLSEDYSSVNQVLRVSGTVWQFPERTTQWLVFYQIERLITWPSPTTGFSLKFQIPSSILTSPRLFQNRGYQITGLRLSYILKS